MPGKTRGMPGYYGSTELREISTKVSTWGIVLYALGIGLILLEPVSTMIITLEKSGVFSVYSVIDTGSVVLGTLISFVGLLTISLDRSVGGWFLRRKRRRKSLGRFGPY